MVANPTEARLARKTRLGNPDWSPTGANPRLGDPDWIPTESRPDPTELPSPTEENRLEPDLE